MLDVNDLSTGTPPRLKDCFGCIHVNLTFPVHSFFAAAEYNNRQQQPIIRLCHWVTSNQMYKPAMVYIGHLELVVIQLKFELLPLLATTRSVTRFQTTTYKLQNL